MQVTCNLLVYALYSGGNGVVIGGSSVVIEGSGVYLFIYYYIIHFFTNKLDKLPNPRPSGGGQ